MPLGIAGKEVTHILEKAAVCGLPCKAGKISSQFLTKEGSQVFLMPCVWFSSFKGKQGLALVRGGKRRQKKASLKSRQVKQPAEPGI